MDHESITPIDVLRASPFRDWSFRQRAGLGFAGLIVLIGMSWTIWSRSVEHFVPLPTTGPLSATALNELEVTFRSAGLTDFHRSGEEILVPAAKLNQYIARLPSESATTDHWADEWERQNERLTPFSSQRDREANREIARAKLITGMLQQLPDVAQADLVWDEEEQPGWRAAPRARATVYLQPKPGRILTLDVIRSVRLAVAGSKRNLAPSDVVVMDLARQVTYEGALPVSLGDELLRSLQSQAELYRREIQQRIPALRDADVDVSVDLPRFLAFVAEHPQDADRRLMAAAPGLLRVAVTIQPGVTADQADESVRPSLAKQITALTGIGRTDADGNGIIVTCDRPTTPTLRNQPSSLWLTWLRDKLIEPSGGRSAAACFGSVILIGLAVLIRRRKRYRPNSSHGSFPALDVVNHAAESFDQRSRLLAFDDLTSLDAAGLRSAYSHATPRRWAVALRGSAAAVREQLAGALDPLDALELRQQCDALGPVSVGDIDSSRQRILESAQQDARAA